jgi:hypothetical protein
MWQQYICLWKKQYKELPGMQQIGTGNTRTYGTLPKNLNTFSLTHLSDNDCHLRSDFHCPFVEFMAAISGILNSIFFTEEAKFAM